MGNNAKETDVRVITLKRWNLPQSKSLHKICQEKGEIKAYGDYVAFHNYHFVDVTPVEVPSGQGILPAAYDVISQARQKNEDDKNKDIYIQQSMVVYGEAKGFWTNKPEVLYITMIQLVNTRTLNMSELQKDIRAQFQNRGVSEDQWTLYYSLDFCDLILFVRDLPLSVTQDILWGLSPVRNGALKQIRDTITIYGLDFKKLMESFDCYAGQRTPRWSHTEEKITLSVALGVRTLDACKELMQKINQLSNVQHTYSRIPGRYDIHIMLDNVDFSQMLQVLWWIDCACEAENDDAFSCYEVVPLVSWEDFDHGQLDTMDHSLHEAAVLALDKLFNTYVEVLKQAGEPVRGYAAEIRRALISLLDNGFSEEFVLSVFHSFTEYLRFVAEMMDEEKTKQNIEDSGHKREKLYTFQKSYLQALNMLAHSTMHSERQFIQAPAFNVTIFDVPPKLLAFYAGVAYKVTELLNDEIQDEEKRTYSFLFSPDFRSDIYVQPISEEGYGSKLLIIYINEQMFYNPEVVIQTMCHEIAHHVGKNARCRKERAEFMLECIGGYLIYTLLPINDPKLVKDMAKAFREEVMTNYERWFDPIGEKGRKYFLTSISSFLIAQDYLCSLIKSVDFQKKLWIKWWKVLNEYDVLNLAEKLDKTMCSGYLQKMYQNNKTKEAAVRQLANELPKLLWAKIQKWTSVQPEGAKADSDTGQMPRNTYFRFCECILQTFSEAYADLRMLDVLEIDRWEDYIKLLETNLKLVGSIKDNWDIQEYLRGSAVLAYFKADEDIICRWSKYLDDCNDTDRLIYWLSLDRLKEYLTLCGKPDYAPNKEKISLCDLCHLVEQTCSHDPMMVFSTIRGIILDYRKDLTDYCGRITGSVAIDSKKQDDRNQNAAMSDQ